MDSLLQEITMLPGVLGCFVFSNKQGIIANKMPPIFKENNIKTIGTLLTRTMQMGSTAQLDFSDIEIKYNESTLLIKPITQDVLLVIISEPNANKSLIVMTSGMMLVDIETALNRLPAQKKTQEPSTLSPETAQSKPAPAQEAEIGEELALIIEKLGDSLALAIGPVAPPVMRDTMEIWAQQTPPTIGNLPALAKLLCQEINDDELEKQFMEAFKNIVG